jgi:hypothetical protein
MHHLIVSSGLVVLAAINSTGPGHVSSIAKELVVFDLVNKLFQQLWLFRTVNMLLCKVIASSCTSQVP